MLFESSPTCWRLRLAVCDTCGLATSLPGGGGPRLAPGMQANRQILEFQRALRSGHPGLSACVAW